MILAIPVFSQRSRLIKNQGFYYTIEATGGYGLPMETDHVTDVGVFSPFNMGIRASANWFLNYHLSAGTSLGYMRYEEPGMTTLPLLISAKWFIGKPATTPFLYADGGVAFRFSNHKQNKGYPYEAGMGYRIPLKKKNSFLIFKLGYSSFKTNEWKWDLRRDGYTDPLEAYKWHYLKRPTLNFTIGYYHSTRF